MTFSFKKPRIYNAQGNLMDIFFLKSSSTWYDPYSSSKYFMWDRYNFGLDTHFYTDNDIFKMMRKNDSAVRKYAIFGEPRSINKKVYKDFLKANIASDFTKILSFDEEILDRFPNAMLHCGAAPWCYMESGDPLTFSEKKYESKTKEISMICSGKTYTPLHLVRNAIANRLRNAPNVDIYGSYVGRPVRYTSSALDSYRYHIAVENMQSKYYFTEKILNCFISMAVPIYIGASGIGEFFNTDGIIAISTQDVDNIEKILKQCSVRDYESRLKAIIENYHTALKYLNNDDRLYEMLFLESKL